MSGGLAHKFHGSEIRVLAGFTADSPAPAITGITSANPAVVTCSGHGLEDGDVVKITGVVGMTQVNNGVFVVTVLSSSTFELTGVNSTGYTAYASGGTFQVADMQNFCELTTYTRTGGTSPEVPKTSLCSTAQEFFLGLPDFGTTQLDYNFAPTTAIQQGLAAFAKTGQFIAVSIEPEGSGMKMVQLGFVQQQSESASVGSPLWVGSTTVRNSGERFDFDVA